MLVFLTFIYALTVSTVTAAPLYFLNMPMNIVVGIWCGAFVIGGIVGPSRARKVMAKSKLRPYQKEALDTLTPALALPQGTGKTVVDDRKSYSFYSPGRGNLN